MLHGQQKQSKIHLGLKPRIQHPAEDHLVVHTTHSRSDHRRKARQFAKLMAVEPLGTLSRLLRALAKFENCQIV